MISGIAVNDLHGRTAPADLTTRSGLSIEMVGYIIGCCIAIVVVTEFRITDRKRTIRFVEFDLAVMIHSTTESVRLYGTPVLTGGKALNYLTVRSGLLTVSCRGLVVPRARNTQFQERALKQQLIILALIVTEVIHTGVHEKACTILFLALIMLPFLNASLLVDRSDNK